MENIGSNADSTTASTGESMTTTVTTNTTLDSSPIHWQNTFAATNLPTPGARENSLLSNINTFRPMSALALPARLRPKAQSPCIQRTNRNRPIREKRCVANRFQPIQGSSQSSRAHCIQRTVAIELP